MNQKQFFLCGAALFTALTVVSPAAAQYALAPSRGGVMVDQSVLDSLGPTRNVATSFQQNFYGTTPFPAPSAAPTSCLCRQDGKPLFIEPGAGNASGSSAVTTALPTTRLPTSSLLSESDFFAEVQAYENNLQDEIAALRRSQEAAASLPPVAATPQFRDPLAAPRQMETTAAATNPVTVHTATPVRVSAPAPNRNMGNAAPRQMANTAPRSFSSLPPAPAVAAPAENKNGALSTSRVLDEKKKAPTPKTETDVTPKATPQKEAAKVEKTAPIQNTAKNPEKSPEKSSEKSSEKNIAKDMVIAAPEKEEKAAKAVVKATEEKTTKATTTPATPETEARETLAKISSEEPTKLAAAEPVKKTSPFAKILKPSASQETKQDIKKEGPPVTTEEPIEIAKAEITMPPADNAQDGIATFTEPRSLDEKAPMQNAKDLLLRVEIAGGVSRLPDSANGNLEQIARRLKANEDERVQILGYADGGTSARDQSNARRLSLSRALAAREVLLEQGIDNTRIDVRALGTGHDDAAADRVDVYLQKVVN